VFVLLPTKEAVFAEKVKDPGTHSYFSKIIDEEDRHRLDLIGYMNQHGISYVDAAPPLKEMTQ
jgi:hypothetical protein